MNVRNEIKNKIKHASQVEAIKEIMPNLYDSKMIIGVPTDETLDYLMENGYTLKLSTWKCDNIHIPKIIDVNVDIVENYDYEYNYNHVLKNSIEIKSDVIQREQFSPKIYKLIEYIKKY